jgi:MATE family multidrug resistance protein
MASASWTETWRRPGGGAEVLRLALPLILSSSFVTLQLFVDRTLLSRYSVEHGAATLPAVMIFWTAFALLHNTAGYVSTFVAQYIGAGRPNRVGPVVWQSLYFSVLAGLAFLLFVPVADRLLALVGHEARLQELETTYFRCLCFSGLPALLTMSASGFFIGRGDTWTVLWINAAGMTVNVALACVLIFGVGGHFEWGIAGAGWAAVAGAWVSALLALALLFRGRHEKEFATRSGWRLEPVLLGRLLRYGVPAGLQWAFDALTFGLFINLVGLLGKTQLAASNIAGNLNLLAYLPTMGMAQAVAVLVGRRLGEDQPDLAERSAWTGFGLAWVIMATVALLYILIPGPLVSLFESAGEPALWGAVAEMAPVLLRFVAVYCLFDSLNLVFSSALRGAGDTRFVTLVVVLLSFPIMVAPTWVSWRYGWGVYWAWGFASAYVIALALTFMWRFRQGKWKAMRVIEAVPVV